jgi:hypothetical protein
VISIVMSELFSGTALCTSKLSKCLKRSMFEVENHGISLERVVGS